MIKAAQLLKSMRVRHQPLSASLTAAALMSVLVAPHIALAADKAMIVLDGSGSMWGQIDGKAKIEIAREVLADVLGNAPAELELGLIAYGHRQKGSCTDIEVLLEPGPGNASAIARLAAAISPKGKTPLSESVRRAAEALRYKEERATVIVITDGLETCNADPCALGRALEASGLDFVAHVVGFGLSPEEGRQVACLAEETGGRYLPAGDAAALGEALGEAMTEVAEFEPSPVEIPPELPAADLDAPPTVAIGSRFSVTWDGPGELHDRVALVRPFETAGKTEIVVARRLVHGDLRNRTIELIAPVATGAYEVQYLFGKPRHLLTSRAIEVVEAAVSLDAPATVSITQSFTIAWIGPGGRRDRIEIIDPRAGRDRKERLRSKRLASDDFTNRRVTLVAPAEPGFYQLLYWNGDNREILASREIEVLAVEVSINAPATASIGTTIPVIWVGPGGRRDAIQVFDPTADGGRGKAVWTKRLVNDDMANRTVAVEMPITPGSYLLRYWNGDNRSVLATLPITVEASDVTLSAPETIAANVQFQVRWNGPGARRDAIQIFDPSARDGRGKVVATVRLVNGDTQAQTVTLSAPDTGGNYLLRYWNGDNRAVLAERALSVR